MTELLLLVGMVVFYVKGRKFLKQNRDDLRDAVEEMEVLAEEIKALRVELAKQNEFLHMVAVAEGHK